MGIDLSRLNVVKQLAAANVLWSPIKGKLWGGTPISNAILGIRPAQAAETTAPPYYGPTGPVATGDPTPYQPSPTGDGGVKVAVGTSGGGRYTNDQAIAAGLDVNQLRRQGLLIEGRGDGQQDLSQQISELYNPALGLLGEQEAQVRAGYPGEVQLEEERFGQEAKKYGTEQEQLLGDVQTQEEKYNKVIATALEDAYRAFNALNQQRRSRFGFGSSAGQAMGELASQEFFRQQGQIGQKQVEGTQEFATEKGRVKTYVRQKLDDLEIQKKDVLAQLKQNFEGKLNEIASARVGVESNKARDRMTLLQDTINMARSIADQDKQVRLQLGMAAVSKMQELAQRAFSPKEFSDYMVNFGIELPGLGGGVTPANMMALNYNPNYKYDQWGNIINTS